MNKALMAIVSARLKAKRDSDQRHLSRQAVRDEKLAREVPPGAGGIERGYHSDLVWPRQDIRLATAAILDAVGSGYTDIRLVKEYAAIEAAVFKSEVNSAYLMLLNDGVIKHASYQVLPGPNFESGHAMTLD